MVSCFDQVQVLTLTRIVRPLNSPVEMDTSIWGLLETRKQIARTRHARTMSAPSPSQHAGAFVCVCQNMCACVHEGRE